MNASLWLANLAAWWLQSSLLLGVGLALPALTRLSPPGARLRYWQGLLAAVVVLPLVQLSAAPMRFAAEFEAGGSWLQAIAAAPRAAADLGSSASLWVLALLAAGCLARLAWLVVGLSALRSWRQEAVPAGPLPALAEMRQQVGAAAVFLVSPRAGSPLTFGLRRPTILLPPGFARLSLDAQRAVACHELLHVRRRDWLAALGEEALRALLWFHPGVWLLLARLDLAREQVVDAEVVRLTGRRREYLGALWSIATSPAAAAGLPFLKRSHLLLRVAQLAQEVPMPRSRLLARLALSTTTLALAAALAIWSFPMAGTALAAGPAAKDPVMRIEGDVQPPRRISGNNPVYPQAAEHAGAEGKTVLECIVDRQGKTSVQEVSQSAGNAELDQAARDAVSTWTFTPATLDGKPVAVYYTLTINWKLPS